jgi:hypothetical protein
MSIYGDPTNAPVWAKGAVLLGSLTATTPAHPAAYSINDGATVTTEWDAVGMLDDDAPFDNGEESIDTTAHSAFGFGIYAKTHKNQEERFTFTALETTLTTLGLLYDASGLADSGTAVTGTLKQRDPSEQFKIALQRENGTLMERKTSESYATIDSIARSLTDGKSVYTVTVTVYPTADNELYDYYLGPVA